MPSFNGSTVGKPVKIMPIWLDQSSTVANGAVWYEAFIKKLKVNGPKDVATGVFGAMMQVLSRAHRESGAKGSARSYRTHDTLEGRHA